MLKRVNWLVILGLGVILMSLGGFWSYYQKNAPTPFDVVDTSQAASDFLPLVVPVTGAAGDGTASNTAPTLQASAAPQTGQTNSPDSGQSVPVTGLVPDRLVIPSIYLDAPILPVHYKDIQADGTTYHQWYVPSEFAVGWQDETALLGLPGNTVLNGHHNAYGMVFKDLIKLNVGDVIIVYSGQHEYRYVVAAKMLLPERGQPLKVRMENSRWIQASTDQRLTLVTCWPANSNTHRVIIVAFPEGTPPPIVRGVQSGN